MAHLEEKTYNKQAEKEVKRLVSELKHAVSFEARQALLSQLKTFLSSSNEEVSEEVKQSVEAAIVEVETKEIEQTIYAEEVAHKHNGTKAEQTSPEKPESLKSKPSKLLKETPLKYVANPLNQNLSELKREVKKLAKKPKQKPAKIPMVPKDIFTQEEDATYRQFFKKIPASPKVKRKSLQPKLPVEIPRPSAPRESIIAIPRPSAPRESIIAIPRPSAPRESIIAIPRPSAPPEDIVSVTRSTYQPTNPPATKLDSAPVQAAPVVASPSVPETLRAHVSQDLLPSEKKKKSFDQVFIGDPTRSNFQPLKARRASEASARKKAAIVDAPHERVETRTEAESIISILSPPKQTEQKQVETKHITIDSNSILQTSTEITTALKEHENLTIERVSHAPTRARRRSTGDLPKK